MNDRPALVVMVGLPRSGKTTIVREVYRPQGYAVVEPDAVRRALYGQAFIASAEEIVWAHVHLMADALRLSGCPVVVDGTHTRRKWREAWSVRGASFHLVPTSAKTCIERVRAMTDGARLEGADHLIEVIERMDREYEQIEMSEIMLGSEIKLSSIREVDPEEFERRSHRGLHERGL